jgi:hypothetical protein
MVGNNVCTVGSMMHMVHDHRTNLSCLSLNISTTSWVQYKGHFVLFWVVEKPEIKF